MKKFLRIAVIVFIAGLAIFIWLRYFYAVGIAGAKAGELNYVVQKGYLWRTYEGKIIQAGLKSGMGSMVQSNEFIFSISDSAVANKLMANSGKQVNLHYKEYNGAVPWRGNSRFVVDSIIWISDVP